MIEAIKQLQNALGYAKFEDEAIKKASLNLLRELDTDLTAEDYEPGSAIEDATVTLTETIDATDSQKEAAAPADDDDDLDEFEGLGDDEDEVE
jgi:hypothetical protein